VSMPVRVVIRKALALAAVCAAGCVSKAPLAVQSFTIDPPAPSTAVDQAGAVVVSMARVRVAPPYAGTSFTYRMGSHRVERDPYATFAAPPGWMLTTAVRGYLRNADFIRDVVEPGGEIPVVASIEADAGELTADLAEAGDATAVLALTFRVYTPAAGATLEKEMFRKTYTRTRPLAKRDADAIVSAWNRDLSEIADEFLADLRPVLMRAPASTP
jgi:cholesterol transport system auxiliary component